VANKLRLVHYLNQFFAGIGAEEKADVAPTHRPGPVGPGAVLAKQLAGEAEIVGTLICGDNFFVEHEGDAVATLLAMADAYDADVLVAGPAFSSGRYGTACGTLAAAWGRRGKPAVTAMNVNNPGVELFRHDVYIVATGPTAISMSEALATLARLTLKVGRGLDIGPAEAEGYVPRGVRHNVRLERGAADRALEMLLAKVQGRPYRTELVIEGFGTVPPPPPVPDLNRAVVALVTESGLVPQGNPDKLETWNASKWFKYPIAGISDLERGQYEAWHGGCDTAGTNDDPDRAVPVDAVRKLEKDGIVGRLYDHYYVTTGNMANMKTMTRIGAEIAKDMKAQGIEAAILTAT
jgi:glycine reductase complex component B subunit gamma